MSKPNRAVLAAGIAVLLLTGCAHVKAPAGQPARQPTPYENILAWNAAIANTNYTIATELIKANEAGEISVPIANRILTAQSKIADADRQLTQILGAGQGVLTSVTAGNVKGLLDQIKASLTEITTSDTAGIKNAKTRAAVQTAVKTIGDLADLIVGALQELKVLP